MPVVYHCPHCRQPVTVPDHVLGRAVGCPSCRNPFQTQRAPSPPPQEVLSLDDDPPSPQKGVFEGLDDPAPNERGRGSGRRGSAYSRRRGRQKMPLSQRLGTIGGIIGGVGVTVFNMNNRRPGKGFDVQEILIAGLIGGVCAGVGWAIGKVIELQMEAQRRADDDD